ncbi:hypothetical protein RQP46_001837 [Phenoliferia psychrophenolica]
MASKYVPPGARARQEQPQVASQHSSSRRDPSTPTATSRALTGTGSTGSRGGGGSLGRGQPSSSISSSGFRMARGEVGRKPSEMEMLASPSRGDGGSDAASLKDPKVQARFRAHISDKLVKFHAAFPDRSPEGVAIPSSTKRREELSIILLDFRKLREGLTAIRRVDGFTAEVYETSVRYAIAAENWSQLAACLPHLLSTALSSLTLASPLPPRPPLPPTHALFLGLYLTYLTIHLSDLPSFHSVLHSSLPSPPNPLPPPLALSHAFYSALLTSNHLSLSRLLAPAFTPPPSPNPLSTEKEDERLQLAIVLGALPRLRHQVWEPIARSYKVFTDLEWLAKVLLFPPGNEGEDAVKAFLDPPSPVAPLPSALSVGRSRTVATKVAAAIASSATVIGIYGVDFQEATFLAALRVLHPRPQVAIFGGGYDDDEAARAEKVFAKFWEDIGKEEGEMKTVFVRVKVGTLEGGGPGAIVSFIEGEIKKAFA